mgnify:CR=1 FL=1
MRQRTRRRTRRVFDRPVDLAVVEALSGVLLEILLAISGIATAVVIFPIVKRVNESVALGYIAARTERIATA